jgi:hypothetical protein
MSRRFMSAINDSTKCMAIVFYYYIVRNKYIKRYENFSSVLIEYMKDSSRANWRKKNSVFN